MLSVASGAFFFLVERSLLKPVLMTLRRKHIMGLLIVFGIIASWAGSAEFANYSEKKAHFDKPYFIVLLNNSWNVLILPLFLLFSSASQFFSNLCSSENTKRRPKALKFDLHKILAEENISMSKLIVNSFVSTFNLVVADYLYFRALSLTSASSGIVIFNLSSIVTYFLSLFLLGETFSWVKVTAVVLSFGGAALVVLSDKISHDSVGLDWSGDSKEWVGDLVMAGGAIFWGIYLVSSPIFFFLLFH